jgi:hypothetical protein
MGGEYLLPEVLFVRRSARDVWHVQPAQIPSDWSKEGRRPNHATTTATTRPLLGFAGATAARPGKSLRFPPGRVQSRAAQQ